MSPWAPAWLDRSHAPAWEFGCSGVPLGSQAAGGILLDASGRWNAPPGVPTRERGNDQGQRYRISGDLTQTDIVMNHTFWIGVQPALTEEMLEYAAGMIEAFLGRVDS